VGGAALALGGATFATLLDRRDALLADADTDARALTARRTLESWLAEMRAGTTPDDGLVGRAATVRTPDGSLSDDVASWTTTADGELRRVRLFVDRSSDRAAVVAETVRRDGVVSRILLAPDVAGLEVRYLTAAFGRREWRGTWDGGALMPGAVTLRLQPRPGDSLPRALQLPITVPLPNGR
jgi:hypothetical protein